MKDAVNFEAVVRLALELGDQEKAMMLHFIIGYFHCDEKVLSIIEEYARKYI